jgi:phage gpG-like protein
MRLLFEIAGDKFVERELVRFGDRAVDATPAFEAIGDRIIEETALQFESEGRHASGGWKPLKEATVKRKQRLGFRPEILQETGSLMDSLTVKGDSNMVFDAAPDGLTFGSRVVYAEAHQNPRPGSPLPRRRMVELTPEVRRQIVKILQRHLVEGLG